MVGRIHLCSLLLAGSSCNVCSASFLSSNVTHCYRITRQHHAASTVGAMWLLPVVTLIVASSSGGVLATALQKYSRTHTLITLVVSAFSVTIGLSLALMILTLYLGRLIIHGLPPGAGVLSVFLPLGPTGQAGFAIFLIGREFKALLPYNNAGNSAFLGSSLTAEVLCIVTTCVAFILWSLATMWMLFALLALKSTVVKSPVPFKMSFWGLVFPNVSHSKSFACFIGSQRSMSPGCLCEFNHRPWKCIRL